MPIRTGKEFLAGLRDDRRIFMDGERIKDVTKDRRFAGAARSLAELFNMQHAPALSDRMTFKSPSIGKITITDAKGGTSMVTIPDVMQSNGVIHVVDTVLLPAS